MHAPALRRTLPAVELDAYRQFSARLTERLQADPDVLAAVAVGSMAELEDNPPGPGSGHDFWIVTRPGAQDRFRDRKRWLPEPERILLFFRETPHGMKALYDDGHLLSYAVFDPDELWLAKVVQYRVLFDRAEHTSPLEGIRGRSLRWAEEQGSDDAWLVGQLLSALVVGVGRARRGEQLSAHKLVRAEAVELFIQLASRHLLAERGDLRDPLDPYRRFERRFPDLGPRLAAALAAPVEAAAAAVLELAEDAFGDKRGLWPAPAAQAVRSYLARSASAR